MSNKTLTDSIEILQLQNLNLIKLVENLTAVTPVVATRTNLSKAGKPQWDPTGYFWYHRYNIPTGHNSETFTIRNPGHNTTEKCGDTEGGDTSNKRWVPKI